MSYNKETGMYEGFIYKIYNDVNDKVYIGQTRRDLSTRWYQHLSKTRHKEDNSILHKAIEKYGQDVFHIEMISKLENDSEEKLLENLDEKEKYYIKTYNTITPNGYNILHGGNFCPITHRIHPLYKYTINGDFVAFYETMTDALISVGETNLKSSFINYHLKRDGLAYGYLWSDKADYNPLQQYIEYQNRERKERRKGKYIVAKYDMDLNFVKYYYSPQEIMNEHNNVSPSSLYRFLTQIGEVKPYKNYYWYYADNETQPDKTKIIKTS